MLQDLTLGALDNQYRHQLPEAEDKVICVRGGSIMVARDKFNTLTLPTVKQVLAWSGEWAHWHEESLRYIFTLQGEKYFLWMGEAGEPAEEAFAYEAARTLRQLNSKHICFAAMTAFHLF